MVRALLPATLFRVGFVQQLPTRLLAAMIESDAISLHFRKAAATCHEG